MKPELKCPESSKTAIVIGGGIFGLCRAYALKKAGYAVKLLEKEERVGGVIQSVSEGGFLADRGPNTLRTGDVKVLNFFNEIGLGEQLVECTAASNDRYIVYKGELVKAPRSLGEFLRTPVFSLKGKLRIALELFVAKGKISENESVQEFFERRFGKEVVEYGVDPFICGVYAGNPSKLSMQHVFPRIFKMEREVGSVLKGLIQAKKEGRGKLKSKAKVLSFAGGMECLTERLTKILKEEIELGVEAQSISYRGERWEVVWKEGGEVFNKLVDELMVTAPAYALGNLPFEATLKEQLQLLNEVKYAPIVTVSYGFREAQVKGLLSGFGFLVPSREPFTILGTLFTSNLFSGRASKGYVLLTTFLGGEHHPELIQLSDTQQDEIIMKDLRQLLKIEGDPIWKDRMRWVKSIPQYELGYNCFLERLQSIEEQYKGLQFLGNYRNGVSLEDGIKVGLRL